jgi:hypothetical protein
MKIGVGIEDAEKELGDLGVTLPERSGKYSVLGRNPGTINHH